jgi:hypothetical protein
MGKCYFAAAPGANPFAGVFKQLESMVRNGLSSN